MKASFILSTIFVSKAMARVFTVQNACPFTIWPAIYTDLNVATSVPSMQNGWIAPPSTSVSFTVPDDWKAGQIWARRDCDFSSNSTVATSCLDGGCQGGLVCDPHLGTPVPPATVGEFVLGGNGNQDFVDVSLVNGFNLPMRISNNQGCAEPSCSVDLNPNGPEQLRGPSNSTGSLVGCKSACEANIDGHPDDSPNCCTGSHNTPATCPASRVAFYSYFKNNCPDALAYLYDDANGSFLWVCDSTKKPDYTITFCP